VVKSMADSFAGEGEALFPIPLGEIRKV